MEIFMEFVVFSLWQASADKLAKQLEAQLTDANSKLDEASRNINSLTSQKSHLQSEYGDLRRQLEESESQINQLAKAKSSLSSSLEESKGNMEEEGRFRNKLQAEVRNLQADLDHLRDQLDEEQESHTDAQRLLTKATSEIAVWRQRLESGEGGISAEQVDDLKRKLNAKLIDAENQLDGALAKASALEKAKNRLQGELEDVMIEMERVSFERWSMAFANNVW